MKYSLILLAISILTSCEGYDYKLEIKNSTPNDMYVIHYDKNTLEDYPNKVFKIESYLILKNSTKKMGVFGTTWEHVVQNSRNKGLNLFVIPVDTVNKYHKDTIIKHKNYYKQLYFSPSELDNKNWFIEIN